MGRRATESPQQGLMSGIASSSRVKAGLVLGRYRRSAPEAPRGLGQHQIDQPRQAPPIHGLLTGSANWLDLAQEWSIGYLTLDHGPRFSVIPMALRVSDLAAEAGVSADTIRFYERKRLLSPPERTSSGYRQFDEAAVRRVRFIKGAQALGLKLAEIRELLDIQDKGACPCGHTRQLVERRIGELDQEIRELQALRADLDSLKDLECLTTEESAGGSWPCEVEFVKRGAE